jgi:pimeloyl-ACP methyl ester carboxylesterase
MNTLIAVTMMVLAMPGDPIETYTQLSRKALGEAGLTRRVDDHGSVYWTGGAEKGDTFVLLHGANDQAGTWAGVVPSLASDYRLIVPDLAGHGESEPMTGPISYGVVLERLHAILEKEAKGKVTIAGNSMGGWIGTLYALDHPGRVERLVLEDASGMMWPITVPLFPKNREEAAAMMRAVNGPADKTPDAVLDAFLAKKDLPMSRFAMPDLVQHLLDTRLAKLKVPVTLIWGRDDGVLPLAYAEALQKSIEGSELKVIDGAAHIPHRQQPEKFVRCLKATC